MSNGERKACNRRELQVLRDRESQDRCSSKYPQGSDLFGVFVKGTKQEGVFPRWKDQFRQRHVGIGDESFTLSPFAVPTLDELDV